MKEFMLIFRMDLETAAAQPTQEQLDRYMADWMQWIGSIGERDLLADGGNHLAKTGCVLRKGSVQQSLYSADHESVAGYILIRSRDTAEAVEIASRCPILNGDGTSVEVRELAAPGRA